ncbi:MAG: hypothetical protein M1833_002565 [Piccolia ochrophora]|nr:MAG: hypothetical protein M1833_002565 [Piccolia ochrophora]
MDTINKYVNTAVGSAGKAAGGTTDATGNTVSQAGKNVGDTASNSTKRWGDSVKDFGNDDRRVGPEGFDGAKSLGFVEEVKVGKPGRRGMGEEGDGEMWS